MTDVEPVESPQPAVPAPAPDRADAAQRRLAEIWSGRDTEAPAVESPGALIEVPGQPSPVADDDADAAQRTLAAIWSTHPTSCGEQRRLTVRPNPLREREDVLIAGLSQQLGERSEAFGSNDPRTIDAQLELADGQLETGRTGDAIPSLEQGIAALESDDTTAADRLASAKGKLAHAYLVTRRPRLAIALYEQLLAERTDASSRSQILGYRVKLAVGHRATGDVSAAVAQLQALATELEGTQGDDDRLLEASVELAITHVVAGHPREAVTQYERSLPLANEVHGAGHCTTLGIRLLLARAHQQAGQSAQAIRSYEQLVSDAERELGPHDKLTTQAASELTLVLRTQS